MVLCGHPLEGKSIKVEGDGDEDPQHKNTSSIH